MNQVLQINSINHDCSLWIGTYFYLFPAFGFHSGICLLIAPVPVHCFSITFMFLGLIASIALHKRRKWTFFIIRGYQNHYQAIALTIKPRKKF